MTDTNTMESCSHDAHSFAERAAEIMRREPRTEKTPAILASFAHPLNYRHPLETIPLESIAAAHGTNFATVVQALRNANGQLVPQPRLPELGIELRTGETAMSNGATVQGPPFVSAGRLQAGLHMAKHYALIETGHGSHFWGVPNRNVLSEASNIPVIVIGEIVDPEGRGKANHEEYYVRNPIWVDNLPKDHPWYGWTYEQVGSIMDAMQIQAERLNIRMLLVWDPESRSRDEAYRDVMKEVIAMLSAEQEIDYSDVPVCMVKELTETQMNCLTAEDIRGLLAIEQAQTPNRHDNAMHRSRGSAAS